jgi:hypothetical protein
MKPKHFLDIVGMSFMLVFSLIVTVCLILSVIDSSWVAVFSFNHFHEGMIELILFPIVTILGGIAMIRYIKIMATGNK